MRVAILSDVHANADALRAVLDDIDRRNVARVVCLGDTVGYGAEPSACLDLLFESCDVDDRRQPRSRGDRPARGLALLRLRAQRGRRSPAGCSRRRSATKLAELPDEDTFGDLLLVHASPVDPLDFPYIRDVDGARASFDARSFRIAFYGHTHVPLVFREDGERVTLTMNPLRRARADDRYLINVGSVGQPRDQDPRACYAIYDSDAARASTFHRVDVRHRGGVREDPSPPDSPSSSASRLLVGV